MNLMKQWIDCRFKVGKADRRRKCPSCSDGIGLVEDRYYEIINEAGLKIQRYICTSCGYLAKYVEEYEGEPKAKH